MKKLLPTILLVIACIGGYWYASSHNFFKEQTDEASKQMLQLKPADVQAIAIDMSGEQVELAKKDGTWQMSKPEPVPVNAYMVDDWLGAFVALSYDTKVDDQPKDMAEFGLEQPMMELSAKLADGTTKKLLVGSALPVAGSYYAKLDDAPAVYSISEQTLQTLGRQAADFAEKNAVQVEYNKVKKVVLSWKGASWTATKKEPAKNGYESDWTIRDKEYTAERGSSVLDKLTVLSSEEMPKAVESVKLDNPELRIEVTEGGAEGADSSSVYVGKIADGIVWIAKQGGSWAYSVPIDQVQDLAGAPDSLEAAAAAPSANPSPSSAPAVSAAPN